jgi:ribonuclease P protein component
VAREGKRIRTEHLELRAVASLLHHPRVGFIVPKHGQSSVARNRLKRRLREIARLELLPGLPPVDVVIRARREAYAARFDALAAQLARAGERLATRFESH